jgi:fructan beta-fructosidase
MTIPRVLTLKQTNGDYTLMSKPIQELNNLRINSKRVPSNRIALLSDNVEIEMEMEETDFQLTFSNNNNEKVILKKENNQITFDRSQSGITDFNADFIKVHKAPLQNILLKNVKIYIDRSSMEFIFNDGELNITELVFPQSPYTILETKGVKEPSTIHQLKSIWGN